MVEVSHNLPTPLISEDVQKTRISLFNDDEKLGSSNRRSTASKRALIRTRSAKEVAESGQATDNRHEDGVTSPDSPNSLTEEDTKRSRAETEDEELASTERAKPRCLFQRRVRNHSAPLLLESLEGPLSPTAPQPEIVCQLSRLPKCRLSELLKSEPNYHPNNAFLYYVDPVSEDKVDASHRNEAIHSLRFMHGAYFTLTAEVFCKAVNLIDRFIVKVKVKPKYMQCVAAAAYYTAAKRVESSRDPGVPKPDVLVQISHCGGTAADLLRMEDILFSKLGGDVDGVTAFDFLRLFASALMVLPARSGSAGATVDAAPAKTSGDSPTTTSSFDFTNPSIMNADAEEGEPLLTPHSMPLPGSTTKETPETNLRPQNRRMHDLWRAMTSRLIIALCSLDIYRFRPAALALGVLLQFRVAGVAALASLCKVQMGEVQDCAALVTELYNVYCRDSPVSSRRMLIWTLSKRTLLRIGCSSPTPLDTISEDCETDKEESLQFQFEP